MPLTDTICLTGPDTILLSGPDTLYLTCPGPSTPELPPMEILFIDSALLQPDVHSSLPSSDFSTQLLRGV